jgi:hypothetical protein
MFTGLPKAHVFGALITFAVLASIGYASVVGSWLLADDFTIISKVARLLVFILTDGLPVGPRIRKLNGLKFCALLDGGSREVRFE